MPFLIGPLAATGALGGLGGIASTAIPGLGGLTIASVRGCAIPDALIL